MDERLVENTICIYVWFKKEINYENRDEALKVFIDFTMIVVFLIFLFIFIQKFYS